MNGIPYTKLWQEALSFYFILLFILFIFIIINRNNFDSIHYECIQNQTQKKEKNPPSNEKKLLLLSILKLCILILVADLLYLFFNIIW